MKRTNIAWSTAVLVAAGLMIAPTAKATLSFTLDQANVALTGPFGTVSVTEIDSTHATVTLMALGVYSFGDGSTLALNLADTGVTMSGLTLTSAGHGGTPGFSGLSSGTVDGWGSFNYLIDLSDGFHSSVTGLTFTLTKGSGTWASEADILSPNGSGLEVAGHVFNSDGSITGYATTAVPEASTIIAGMLLVLPLGASAIRILRKARTALAASHHFS